MGIVKKKVGNSLSGTRLEKSFPPSDRLTNHPTDQRIIQRSVECSDGNTPGSTCDSGRQFNKIDSGDSRHWLSDYSTTVNSLLDTSPNQKGQTNSPRMFLEFRGFPQSSQSNADNKSKRSDEGNTSGHPVGTTKDKNSASSHDPDILRARDQPLNPPFQFSASIRNNEKGKSYTNEPSHRRNYKAQTNSWQERSGHRRSYLASERSGHGSERGPRDREYYRHRQLPAPPSRSFYREVPKQPPMLKDIDSSASKSYPENADRGIPHQIMDESLPHIALQDAVGEEAASLMVRASLTANLENQINTTLNDTPEHIPASQRLGRSPNSQAKYKPKKSSSETRPKLPATQRLGPPPRSHSHRDVDREERVPATMRIGQALTDANTENEASAPCTTKRKPGRPPGSSKAPGKQTMPASPAPKKRRVSQPKPSPARRKSNAAKTTKKSDARGQRRRI
ncbi:LOW QUALITY PROTEIN: hypothetical protein HID58_028840 [Brassica napus]|uniref:Uncharacterized protein n=1 Tax=Brassica napus TaxID=3708 RepID=A0ABQ8CBD9_BRANA|nr:LOW QUALITY PROTEIN: hypothetical protein HID58_028840 [Brassica napus]